MGSGQLSRPAHDLRPDRLTVHSLEVDALVSEAVTDVAAYDAVVVGSAVYAGRWRRTARDFVARFEADIRATTGAVDHRLFADRLELSRLRFAERAIVAALPAPFGDYRPFDEI